MESQLNFPQIHVTQHFPPYLSQSSNKPKRRN